MEPTNLLLSTAPVVDPDDPARVTTVIDDAWGLIYAQGGVVMAAMLRAAEQVLGRDDLRLAAASATFCRPVHCGVVTIDVDVLRNGRRGAQVQASLRVDSAEGSPDALATVVFADDAGDAPTLSGLVRPDGLRSVPEGTASVGGPGGDDRGLAFLRQTEWRLSDVQPDDETRRLLWFRFAVPPVRDDGTWDPAVLVVPGDSLGSATTSAVASDEPITSVSLQISIQVFAPVRSTWLGIDSVCFHAAGGTVSGLATLWDDAGNPVATVSQTAMFR